MNAQPDNSREEAYREARKQIVRSAFLALAALGVIVFACYAWFVSSGTVTGTVGSVRIDGSSFELASVGGVGVYDNLMPTDCTEPGKDWKLDENTPGKITGEKSDILWRISPDSNLENGKDQTGISPGSHGQMQFYIIPKRNGDLTLKFDIELAPLDKYGKQITMDVDETLELYLKSMNNRTGTTVSFDEGASLTVGGKAVPLNGGTRVQVYGEAIKWDEGSISKVVSCDFTLTYTLAGISSQFPIRANDKDEIGIQVNATSKLSCVEDMSQTSMEVSEADETGNLFYQKDLHLATLTYNAYENAYGTQRYGWSQLGINDLDSNGDYQILSAALYDVHELTNASSADTLKISVQLKQKTDDGDYKSVGPLSSYLNSITVSPKGNPTVISTAAASVRDGAAEFRIKDTGFNSSVPIEIDVDMDVITGAAFEKAGLTYANYKLVLTAELLQGDKTIEGSEASDHIIYTNAKIIPTLVS